MGMFLFDFAANPMKEIEATLVKRGAAVSNKKAAQIMAMMMAATGA